MSGKHCLHASAHKSTRVDIIETLKGSHTDVRGHATKGKHSAIKEYSNTLTVGQDNTSYVAMVTLGALPKIKDFRATSAKKKKPKQSWNTT